MLYALGYLLPPLVWWSAWMGGAWFWLPVAALYVGVPIADALARPNPLHPSTAEVVDLEHDPLFRLITWLWVPLHIALIVWAVDLAATMPVGLAWAGLVVSVGSTGGAIGITFAHELVHRRGRFERALGDVLLALVSYPHFATEHVHGHHRHVATPMDPATARLGEGLYRFLPRTGFGGLAHAWTIACEQQARRHRAIWHPSNAMLRCGATMAAVYAGVGWTWGARGLLFFVLQAPQLPAGYATMLLLALVPPLWRRVMDPRVPRP